MNTIKFLKNNTKYKPDIGIILGTGLGGLVNEINIEFFDEVTSIRVYNMLGELVANRKIDPTQRKINLLVSDWKPSTYSVQLFYKERLITHKLFNILR